MAEQAAEFERYADTLATLTASSRGRTTDRDRAIAALRMFSAREALERIEDALSRIDDGSYAICQSCGRPIAVELLETVPQAQLCAACGTDSIAARTSSARSLPVEGDACWPNDSVQRFATTMTSSRSRSSSKQMVPSDRAPLPRPSANS
jgi:RNA polymerase-binding transcription factor DksA